MEEKGLSCFAIYSHPQASVMKIEETVFPTITVKMAKGTADGPLVLIDREEKQIESVPNDNGSIMCEQSSWFLHRTGRFQRYVSRDREE